MPTMAEVKDQITSGVVIVFRRHPWHKRRRAMFVTSVSPSGSGRLLMVHGHPTGVQPGSVVKTWKAAYTLLYPDSEVEFVTRSNNSYN